MFATQPNALYQESRVLTAESNILVPVNFTRRSEEAAAFAISLARHFEAKVTLLHVEKPLENSSFWSREAARWAKQQMAGFLPASRGLREVQRMVAFHSDVSGEILRNARDIGADLIVMPINSLGNLRRAILGSVGARILHDAACPVWASPRLVQSTPEQEVEMKRILCAVDSAAEAGRVLSWASMLAAEWNASLCVAWSRKGLADAPEQMNQLERRFRLYAEAVIEPGDMLGDLRSTAARMQADLLVVGRKGGHAQGQPELDVYQLVRVAPCPVVRI